MLGLSRQRKDRGDTLIEVLFGITIFSLVIVGSLSIMNQGTAASQRALEITLVRQQLDAQAETLRFMHDSYVALYTSSITFDTDDNKTSPAEEWYKMSQVSPTTQASEFGAGGTKCPDFPRQSFVVDTTNVIFRSAPSDLKPAQTFAQTTNDSAGKFTGSEGIWIEAVRSAPSEESAQSNTGYIDFHIRACWDSSGLTVPITLGTIVRLYEPRG